MTLFNRLRDPGLRNIAVYGAATGLAAFLTLVLTRVLWHTLSPEDFGVWALIDPLLLPAASLVLLGIDHAIVKQLRLDHLPLPVVTGTLLVATVPASLLCLVTVGVVSNLVFHLGWTDALLLTMAGEALFLMLQTAFRATGGVYAFAAILLARNLLYLAVLLTAKFYARPALLSVGLIFLTRGGCVILVSLAALAALHPIMRIDWARYRDALHYGFPLLLTTFIYALTDMTDRWFVAEFTGVVAVGVYSLHLKLAAILAQAIVIPFGLWFPPERFKRLEDPDGGRRFFIRTAAILTLICGYLSGALWLARDPVLALIAPGAHASPLVLACCLGAVICLALSQALNVGLLVPGHTGKNAICNAYTAVAAVAAAAMFVPAFGMNGAAASRLVGGLVLVGVTAMWSNRIFPIAFPFAAMSLYLGLSALAAGGIDRVAAGYGLIGTAIALIAWTIVVAALGAVFWAHLRAAERGTRPLPLVP